ncbi:hypothetical protein D7X33_27265, partial [Butyricicoccus sp. 1XD8-22]
APALNASSYRGGGLPFLFFVDIFYALFLSILRRFFLSVKSGMGASAWRGRGGRGVEGRTVEIMIKEKRGIQSRCLSSLCCCLKNILNRNDKSEPAPCLENSVRIIMK